MPQPFFFVEGLGLALAAKLCPEQPSWIRLELVFVSAESLLFGGTGLVYPCIYPYLNRAKIVLTDQVAHTEGIQQMK